jgi:hypothetical protein
MTSGKRESKTVVGAENGGFQYAVGFGSLPLHPSGQVNAEQ